MHPLNLAYKFLLLYGLVSALSIAGSQMALGCMMASCLWAFRNNKKVCAALTYENEIVRKFYLPIVIWLLVSSISLVFGLKPFNSMKDILKFSLFLPLPLFVMMIFNGISDSKNRWKRAVKFLSMVIISHGLAGIHTVLSSRMGYEIKPKIPGPLSESGQFELLFPVIFLLPFMFWPGFKRSQLTSILLPMSLIFTSLILYAWTPRLGLPNSLAMGASFVILFGTLFFIFKRRVEFGKDKIIFMLFVSMSSAAFLLNLKRGPWFGVFCEFAVVSLLMSRKTFFLGTTLSAVLLFFSPIYDRIASMSEHFFIGGGRFDMWKLGFQLIERFPLGIGFGNSDLIRVFDPTLPLLHRHMHNNLLNIVLETGVLGGLFYVMIYYQLFLILREQFGVRFSETLNKSMFQSWGVLSLVLFIGIIGWQVAGFFEYNFGDGEIRLLALVFMGILLVAAEQLREQNQGLA